MVLTVSFVISPVIGFLATVACGKIFRRLDASTAASGPHDFAVRVRAIRQRRVSVHRIPPRGRDDRVSPLCGTGPHRYRADLPPPSSIISEIQKSARGTNPATMRLSMLEPLPPYRAGLLSRGRAVTNRL